MSFLKLCVCLILLAKFSSSEKVNIALNKTAYQRSESDDVFVAGNAVDGNDATCSQTQEQKRPWWLVDLGDEYSITSVEITSQGHCSELLSNFQIELGNIFDNTNLEAVLRSNYKKIAHEDGALSAGETREIQTGRNKKRTGRYLFIMRKDKSVLTLCEVKVYGDLANMALRKPAFQSSTQNIKGKATNAVDGKPSVNLFRLGSCTHTKPEVAPWLVVDLGKIARVYDVTITGRKDCCWERLRNITIELGYAFNPEETNTGLAYDFQDYTKIASIEEDFKKGETKTITTAVGGIGRYLKIQMTGSEKQFLTLCEVAVRAVAE